MSNEAGEFVERFANSINAYDKFLRDGAPAALETVRFAGVDSAEAVAFWTVLNRHRSDADRRLAIRTLRTDGNRRNRMMAAAILGNFPASDDAWRALAEALRDSYTGVNVTALITLSSLGNQHARPVDWTPVASSLRASLDGANLQAFLPLVRVLVQTSASPALARPLLAGGGELLVAHAEAADVRSRTSAVALLQRLRGTTTSPSAWREWIATL
jgi:hypothetical protein